MYDNEPLESQVKRLATFITENFPGEPSTPDGAIDVAIRLIQGWWQTDVPQFVIKATDRFAPDTIRIHRRQCMSFGIDDQASEDTETLKMIEEWQSKNRDKVDFPRPEATGPDSVTVQFQKDERPHSAESPETLRSDWRSAQQDISDPR